MRLRLNELKRGDRVILSGPTKQKAIYLGRAASRAEAMRISGVTYLVPEVEAKIGDMRKLETQKEPLAVFEIRRHFARRFVTSERLFGALTIQSDWVLLGDEGQRVVIESVPGERTKVTSTESIVFVAMLDCPAKDFLLANAMVCSSRAEAETNLLLRGVAVFKEVYPACVDGEEVLLCPRCGTKLAVLMEETVCKTIEEAESLVEQTNEIYKRAAVNYGVVVSQ
jgi:hypothetical protein